VRFEVLTVVTMRITVLRNVMPCSLVFRNRTARLHGVTLQNIVWRFARQLLAEHVPERYALNKNRRPLLDNGFDYHGITIVSDTTTALEPLKVVSSIRFARGYKR
jgi:hypothetical protein